MKLKPKPDDFRVDEIAEPALGAGPFALYRLAKKSLGTPEAINAICRAWRLSREAIAVGGLKDRHAATRQFLSIENGPHRNLDQTNLTLEYLGQTARRFESKDILANHFEITAPGFCGPRRPKASSSHCRRRRKRGCRITSTISASVRSASRATLSRGPGAWGITSGHCGSRWPNRMRTTVPTCGRKSTRSARIGGIGRACRQQAVRPMVHLAMERLCRRPRDFRGAFIRIPQHERRLYLEAFQSFLWNRVLAEWIRGMFGPTELFDVEIARSPVPFYRVLPQPEVRQQLAAALPYPSARERSELGPLTELYERGGGRVRPGVPRASRQVSA